MCELLLLQMLTLLTDVSTFNCIVNSAMIEQNLFIYQCVECQNHVHSKVYAIITGLACTRLDRADKNCTVGYVIATFPGSPH